MICYVEHRDELQTYTSNTRNERECFDFNMPHQIMVPRNTVTLTVQLY